PADTTPPVSVDPPADDPPVDDPPVDTTPPVSVDPPAEAQPWVEPPRENTPPVDPVGSESGRTTAPLNTDTGRSTQPGQRPQDRLDPNRRVVTRQGMNFEFVNENGVWVSTQPVTWRAALSWAAANPNMRPRLQTLAPSALTEALPWRLQGRRARRPRDEADGSRLIQLLEQRNLGSVLDSPIEGLFPIEARQLAGWLGFRLPDSTEQQKVRPISDWAHSNDGPILARTGPSSVVVRTIAQLSREERRKVEVRLALP
ncbi:MAG: hypothetical protein KDD82_22765, partial [Planctomycetes bacterium]|nr:hypothetical protein [Planctomycetota bacterium]